jgi:hypothetical protein
MTTPLQAAHARQTAKLRAELRDLLQRHLRAAHAIRTASGAEAMTTVRSFEDAHESSFKRIVAKLDELHRLERAAEWIRSHAHEVHVDAAPSRSTTTPIRSTP